MKAVEAVGVEKRYGRLRALRDVCLEIPQGTALLVEGANAAGKSTLLRVLAGLTRPTRGKVSILGEPLYASGARRVRGRIGFLGVACGLYSDLSARENLAFYARVRGISGRQVDASLERVDLTSRADQPVRTLSLGYRRRAGLARTLLGDPDLLLLDEPWNGLDVEAADRLARILAESRERAGPPPTLLVAAHAADARRGLFDGGLRLRDGAIEA